MANEPAVPENQSRPTQRRRRLKAVVHLLILVVTLAAVGWEVTKAVRELGAGGSDQAGLALHPWWLFVSAVAYLAGLALLGIPWKLVLNNAGSSLPLPQVAGVYLMSHVGKYVPGKAMVLVIRCGIFGPCGVPVGVTILTSFYETFATMASGSLASALCLTTFGLPESAASVLAANDWIFGLVALMLLGFMAAITPLGFGLFTRVVTLPFAARPDWRASVVTMFVALMVGLGSWAVIGTSYLAVLNAVAAEPLGLSVLPLATAGVAMSIVLGFVSMLPGQVGVRELVLIETLKPLVGAPVAVTASLAFRLITIVTELLAAGPLYLWLRPRV
jgi:uncharacterized membrane protein YbhN (UPF0104 family)